MKKIIIIFVFIAKCHILFSQEENLVVFLADATTNSVPVYANDTSMDCITNIKEDSIKKNLYDVEILVQSNNRYKVCITSSMDENTSPINGWVDKESCGVLLHGRYVTSDVCIVSLYLIPDQPYPFLEITDKYADGFGEYTNNKAVPILDYKLHNGEYWIKTVIIKDNKKIVGWTKDYCPNVFGSCN